MDLSQFISNSLTQVFEGIEDAQSKVSNNGSICPVIRKDSIATSTNIPALSENGKPIEFMEFDVSVKVDDKNEVGAKMGITIASFSIGGSGKSTSTEGAVSRLKFRIPVIMPTN